MGRMKKKIEKKFGSKIKGKVSERVKEKVLEFLEDPPGEEGTEKPKQEPGEKGLLGKIHYAFVSSDDEVDDLENK